jgi:hypothetical protein
MNRLKTFSCLHLDVTGGGGQPLFFNLGSDQLSGARISGGSYYPSELCVQYLTISTSSYARCVDRDNSFSSGY